MMGLDSHGMQRGTSWIRTNGLCEEGQLSMIGLDSHGRGVPLFEPGRLEIREAFFFVPTGDSA